MNILILYQEFSEELEKIVSNSPIEIKRGGITVKGIHVQKVKLWITKLGF